MFTQLKDANWEWLRPNGYRNLNAEGKILTYVRKSLLTEQEASDFMLHLAGQIHRTDCPAYGKRSHGDPVKEIPGSSYNRVFMFYAKNKFDALYVNAAFINAMLSHKIVGSEIQRSDKPRGGRGATMNTRWKSDIVSMFPDAGYQSSNESTYKDTIQVAQSILNMNKDISDMALAAIMVFNDYCPTQVTNVILRAFQGDYGLEVAERFNVGYDIGEGAAFFEKIAYIDYEDVLEELKGVHLYLPASMKQPSTAYAIT